MSYVVKLEYFKDSGKWYEDGQYESEKEHLFEIWDEVRAMSASGSLPGITTGRWYGPISVCVPEHPHNHPHLVMP